MSDTDNKVGLPSEIDYTKKLGQLSFDLVTRGFLIPSSLYLRYEDTITNTTAASFMKGVPFSTPFTRSDVYSGSSIIETIPNYSMIYNFIINTRKRRVKHIILAF